MALPNVILPCISFTHTTVFLVPWSAFHERLQTSKRSFYSIEPGICPRTGSWKKPLSDWARWQKAIGGKSFTKKWKSRESRTSFSIWFEAEPFFLGRGWSRFSESGSQDLSNVNNAVSLFCSKISLYLSVSQLANFFFGLHIHIPWADLPQINSCSNRGWGWKNE